MLSRHRLQLPDARAAQPVEHCRRAGRALDQIAARGVDAAERPACRARPARPLSGLDDRRPARRRLRRRPQLRRAGRARRPRPGDAEPARRRDDRPRRRVLPRRCRRRRQPDRGRGEDAVRRGDQVRAGDRRRGSRASSSHEELLARLDALVPAGASSCAIRLDGRFELVRARSVPAQTPPYRPLAEVVADQHVFELEDVEGTMLGFRFPAYVEGIEVAGYHLHFISDDRRRGGHVLDSRSERAAGPARSLRRPPRRAAARRRAGRPRPGGGDPRGDRPGGGRLTPGRLLRRSSSVAGSPIGQQCVASSQSPRCSSR